MAMERHTPIEGATPDRRLRARTRALALWGALVALLGSCATTQDRWVDPAETALARGELDTAVAYYQAATEEAPDDLVIRTRLALLLIEQGDAFADQGRYQLADARYTAARDQGGTVVETVELLLRHAAVREAAGVDPALRAEPLATAWEREESLDALRLLADARDAAGDVQQARDTFAVLVQREPENAAATLRLAQLEESLGQDEAARAAYQRFLSLEPDSMVGRLGLAGLLEAQGDLTAAEALYLAVTQAQPQHAGAWRQLLAFYQRTGNADGAARVRTEIAARWTDKDAPKRPLR